jgi:hypothetical protein
VRALAKLRWPVAHICQVVESGERNGYFRRLGWLEKPILFGPQPNFCAGLVCVFTHSFTRSSTLLLAEECVVKCTLGGLYEAGESDDALWTGGNIFGDIGNRCGGQYRKVTSGVGGG